MDNRVNDQPAFILHRREYQDASLILELFTRDFGRVSVLAKGARKGRNAAHFQIGNRLAVGWSGRSELKTLIQIDSRPLAIAQDCYIALFYLNELLLYLLPRHDPHPRLFDHYQQLLLELEASQLEPLLRNFEMDLLEQLGVLADFSTLGETGEPLAADRFYRFDVNAGLSAAAGDETGVYPGAALLALQQRRFDQPQVLKLAKALLRKIIDYNLQGRTLQSRQFYHQLKS